MSITNAKKAGMKCILAFQEENVGTIECIYQLASLIKTCYMASSVSHPESEQEVFESLAVIIEDMKQGVRDHHNAFIEKRMPTLAKH